MIKFPPKKICELPRHPGFLDGFWGINVPQVRGEMNQLPCGTTKNKVNAAKHLIESFFLVECPNTSFYLTNLIQTSMVLGFEKKTKACCLVLTRIDEKTPGANMLPCFCENASSRAKLHDQNLGFKTRKYSQEQ